jgi:alpha-glucosidase
MPPDAAEVNVELQREDPRSMLTLHRRLIALRRAEPALATGDWRLLVAEGDLLGYTRQDAGRTIAVLLNLGPRPVVAQAPERGRILLSTGLDREDEILIGHVNLRGDEGLIIELD